MGKNKLIADIDLLSTKLSRIKVDLEHGLKPSTSTVPQTIDQLQLVSQGLTDHFKLQPKKGPDDHDELG